jgi:hypothetical protein
MLQKFLSTATILAILLLYGCFGSGHKYKSVWHKVYGKTPPYSQQLESFFSEE